MHYFFFAFVFNKVKNKRYTLKNLGTSPAVKLDWDEIDETKRRKSNVKNIAKFFLNSQN